ncbi:MAG: hypothetical protein M3478_11150 [Planctomycetota bacterium]|nr:hypothetical protein [Planctomycetota bacterium]
MKAAIAEVAAGTAFRRLAAGRHNIAELALHHAYYVREVRSRLAGVPLEPFVLEGADFWTLDDESTLRWDQIRATLASEQERLAAVVEDESKIAGKTDDEKLELVLGITCHAVYHAGQIQLIKALIA